ncbi:hypothetical protein ACFQ15_05690 [Sphingomonas hankookensis]|uniref:hypothetical protein n=1 Tax=Sphingomonas hankookensis TaxID=563996 RepID=UPI001F5AA8D0|nr:hypothetical protein [Sphingomonas hankookensis]
MSRYGRLPGSKNSSGVYEPTHSLEHPKKHGGCMPLAEIHMLERPEGWRVVVAYSFTTGSWAGSSSPLMDCDPVFATYDLALDVAINTLRKCAKRYLDDPKMVAEVRKIEAWCDTLRPVQPDLFS